MGCGAVPGHAVACDASRAGAPERRDDYLGRNQDAPAALKAEGPRQFQQRSNSWIPQAQAQAPRLASSAFCAVWSPRRSQPDRTKTQSRRSRRKFEGVTDRRVRSGALILISEVKRMARSRCGDDRFGCRSRLRRDRKTAARRFAYKTWILEAETQRRRQRCASRCVFVAGRDRQIVLAGRPRHPNSQDWSTVIGLDIKEQIVSCCALPEDAAENARDLARYADSSHKRRRRASVVRKE